MAPDATTEKIWDRNKVGLTREPLRESLVTLSDQGPCEHKPSLANCIFQTLAHGFLEGFSVRNLSICAVKAAVPDDLQKELAMRRPELPIVSVTLRYTKRKTEMAPQAVVR